MTHLANEFVATNYTKPACTCPELRRRADSHQPTHPFIRRHLASAIGLLALISCAHPPAAAPPIGVRSIAVLPPNNRTGDMLLVAGASALEKYALDTERITVPDVLASEARFQLAHRSFTVAAPETLDAATAGHVPTGIQDAATMAARTHLDGAVLYIDVRRWDTDVPFRPAFVIASVQVTLIDAASGRVLWSADHPARPIPTPGVVNLGDAYTLAARAVMAELLAPLGVEQVPAE